MRHVHGAVARSEPWIRAPSAAAGRAGTRSEFPHRIAAAAESPPRPALPAAREPVRLVLEQGEQKVPRERAADAGRRLRDAPRPRPPVETFRHQLGKHERHAAQSAVRRRPSRLLVEQGNDELFEKERHPFGGFDRLRDHLVGQHVGARNRPRQLEAIRHPQMLEPNRLVDLRKRRALGKGPHRQHARARAISPRRRRCRAAVRPMTGPASAHPRSRGSAVARARPARRSRR